MIWQYNNNTIVCSPVLKYHGGSVVVIAKITFANQIAEHSSTFNREKWHDK